MRVEGGARPPCLLTDSDHKSACEVTDISVLTRALPQAVDLLASGGVPCVRSVTGCTHAQLALQMQKEFNLLSPDFDPELALSAAHVTVPFPAVQPLNNVAACKVLMPEVGTPAYLIEGSKHKRAQRPAAEASTENAAAGPIDDTSSAGPSAAGQQPKAKPLLAQWRESFVEGPLCLLRKLHHRPVRVLVRRQFGLRGWCEGQLQLFDRHMNLVLLEAVEHFVQADAAEQQRCRTIPTPAQRQHTTSPTLAEHQPNTSTPPAQH